MIAMSGQSHYDLWFDPNQVGGDLVVECWISHGPRAEDRSFDPQPGDTVLVGDDDETPLSARVTRREGDRVWVQIALTPVADAVA
jgi:hypothetical protein